MIIRVLLFMGVVGGALFLPFWYFVPLASLYAFFFSPYELLIVAVLVDAGFGDEKTLMGYYYTLAVSFILILTTFMKPYLRF